MPLMEKSMQLTYDDIHQFAGKTSMYPVQAACKKLVEQGYTGKLEIYPNKNVDGDDLPDVIYPSIVHSAKSANAQYLQKDKDYASWDYTLGRPIAKKKQEDKKTGSSDYVVFLSEDAYQKKKIELKEQLAIIEKCEYIERMYNSVVNKNKAA